MKTVKRARFDINQLLSMQTDVPQAKVEATTEGKKEGGENLLKA